MATDTSILAWEDPWTEEPGGIQSIGSQRIKHDLVHIAHKSIFRHGISLPTPPSVDEFQ